MRAHERGWDLVSCVFRDPQRLSQALQDIGQEHEPFVFTHRTQTEELEAAQPDPERSLRTTVLAATTGGLLGATLTAVSPALLAGGAAIGVLAGGASGLAWAQATDDEPYFEVNQRFISADLLVAVPTQDTPAIADRLRMRGARDMDIITIQDRADRMTATGRPRVAGEV